MGKGSYLGGHTILGRYSDWFSGYSGRTYGLKTEENAGTKKKTQPVNKKKTQPVNIAIVERDFMHQVAHAIASSNPMPKIPKKIRQQIELDVQNLGGIEAWARTKESFHAILEKKKKRHRKSSSTRQLRSPGTLKGQAAVKKNIDDGSKGENIKGWVEDLNTQIADLNKQLRSASYYDKSKIKVIARKIAIIANRIDQL